MVVGQTVGEGLDRLDGDEPHPVAHLLDAGDLQALTMLDRLDEVGRLDQGFGRAGVGFQANPRLKHSTRSWPPEVFAWLTSVISSRPAAMGLSRGGNLDHLVVVEVEPGDREVRPRPRRLLLDRDGTPVGVEGDDAVTLVP